MIDLRDFVDVNITRIKPTNRLSYDTVVVIDPVADAGYYSDTGLSTGTGTIDDPKPLSVIVGKPATSNFMKSFIANNGKSVHLSNSLKFNNDAWFVGDDALPTNEVIIYGDKNSLTDLLKKGTGIQKKVFVSGDSTWTATDYTDSFALCTNPYVAGAVCTYLTSIDINLADIVKDVAFTAVKGFNTFPADTISTQLVNTSTSVAYLAGDYRLLGGDDTVGQSITNDFMQIILTEELTNQLLNLLTSKIRLDSNGIASVKAACSRVLNRFVTNGYISTEKAWTDPDLYIDGELIAAENTPLIDGYKIHVGPITQDNIEKHQIPPVYILYGDQVGVRKIVVTGEVF